MSAAVAAAAAEEAGAAGEIRVLAVDHDESCLAALNQALVDCRCNVTTCSQATKALGMLVERRERFDLVLSDAYMPDMDVIRLIEHVGLEMDVPFAVMCSDSSSSSLLNALRHGALDYLVKPINTEELRNLCHHIVRIKSSDNYNEHAQSACIYCSKQSRPAKRKIEWTKEPSRVKSPRSSKGISTVHFPQKPEKFPVLQVQTGLKLETKEESSGSKRPRVLEDSGSKRPRFVDNSGLKTLRFVWTPTLHGKFVDAVLYLGINKATPSNIMPSMNVEGLPWANLDIHLQKYDLFLQRLACLPPFKETSVPPRVRTVKSRQGNATAFHSAPSDQQQQFVNESIRSEPNNFSEEGVISGRLKEFRKLKQLIGVSSNSVINVNLARTENVSVLPIVGHGGVGKTMLALKIFNDNNVRDYFDCTFWISASDVFDEQDLIRKFICSVAEHEMESDDLGCIQRVLTGGVVDQSKRFLFIVDNVQEDACTEFSDGWRNSIAILKHARPGSMVLMTTRSLKVANVFGTMDSFLLTDFPDVDLWELFKIHAFGYGSFISNRFLEDTGKRIVEKLNGIPLAAKILGRLLSLNLNAEYWSSILRSELWELPEEKNGVCPALVLSYQYLPSHLKQCFSFCSTYPKGYKFDKDILVDCWAAVGLVVPHEDMLVQDVGYLYFDQLVNRYFFQKFPTSSKYIMSDMLHDLAIFAAKNECLMIRDKNDLTRVQSNIRHLSVLSNNSLDRSSLKGLRYKKLQSLVCYGVDPSTNITRVVQGWLHKLTEIRMLSFVSCQLKELPESIGNLRHLRYLNISSCTFDKLPSSFWGLQKLEILDAQECKFQYLPKDITRLINLQRVKLKVDLINQFRDMPEIGKLSSLRQLPYFDVGNEHGRGIRELKNMNQLRGSLEISGLLNVISRYAAAEAELHKKNYLNKLILSWDQSERACTRQVTTAQEKEVIEGLCPSPYLKHLEIKCYMGVVLHPSWFAKKRLRSLSSLSIYSCPNLASLSLQSSASTSNNRSSIGLSWLTKLSISRCRRLSSLERFLQPDYLPAIKVLHIEKCEDLVSLSAEGFAGFVHLEELELSECWSLNWSANLAFPPFLKELKLEACGDISESTLSCLGNLSTLTTLKLQFCHLVRSIPAQVWGDLVSLENLTIFYCKGLQSIGGSDAIAQIENVDIRDCPNLHDLEQPFHKGGNVH